MLTTLTSALVDVQTAMILAAPDPKPTAGAGDGHTIIDTGGILTFLLSWVAPILLAVLGLIFIGRAKGGQVSSVMTSSGIAMVGLAFLGGAGALVLLGDDIVNLIIG